MIRRAVAAALCLAAAPAFAFHCPADMQKIDAGTSLSDADLTTVRAGRTPGEAQHNAGDQDAPIANLARATKMLGIRQRPFAALARPKPPGARVSPARGGSIDVASGRPNPAG